MDTEANDQPFDALDRKTVITHTPTGGGYDLEDQDTAPMVTVGLRDDDAAGLVLSTRALTLVDEGNAATYTVALRSDPGEDGDGDGEQ